MSISFSSHLMGRVSGLGYGRGTPVSYWRRASNNSNDHIRLVFIIILEHFSNFLSLENLIFSQVVTGIRRYGSFPFMCPPAGTHKVCNLLDFVDAYNFVSQTTHLSVDEVLCS